MKISGMVTIFALATAAVVSGCEAFAQDALPLKGEVFVFGKTPIDPPPSEPKNSHAYMTVTGPAAVRLYRAMRGKEENDSCRQGRKIKRAGSLSCSLSASGKDGTCDFSIDIFKGTLDSGRPC